jgi:hypothetical protein
MVVVETMKLARASCELTNTLVAMGIGRGVTAVLVVVETVVEDETGKLVEITAA